MRRFQVDPPPETKAEADEYMRLGEVFRQQGQAECAFEAFRRGFSALVTAQTGRVRFHKGRELANMGVRDWTAVYTVKRSVGWRSRSSRIA